MTDKKFTDEEIKKGLEICTTHGGCVTSGCPFHGDDECIDDVMDAALDLINRYEEKIKKLAEALDFATDCIGDCEYACHKVYNSRIDEAVNVWNEYANANDIYNLIKERS